MQKLVQGIHDFRAHVFRPRREWFERLADGQRPMAAFVTCSDSRVNPNLITQTEPGELFIVRNAGNIVPPHHPAPGGEEATLEFAVAELGIRDVIVCGHTRCGAMSGLLNPGALGDLPAVRHWLGHAEATRRIIRDKYAHLSDQALLTAAAQENVLVQLENLRTHPAVAAGLARGKLKLHGWVYKIETGEVFAFDPGAGQFVPLTDRAPPEVPVPRLTAPAI
ncbi:carbonic anhydrase : Carbonic anhydrase OS=Planctomyces brasiliensis (strain ATCC 49424 / DSM 5305 / JCM 21570 / NBRC 103401 / IFAM 1448) GN=Plabr_1495 PE=3 SV=1: Pro_CA [Gemmata massiliana]|uniref:Carbonic anhydrase n=1 Tax=Gemmata massiliana TaxID=1210884 RepID=A0A6P2CV43_9BACT|nr:carbonic anhydrase [Gemmata massiliana]VTR92773.1 carbonic anhydrase : Carbonic anhydrase OS=Planctomyces brasiliensis (strain ATCC 49424 / DSM 5305 / JCM 21570 / NBRC 103401 / IFAM 1448) GN=Plabr_1495 PE=3 SV=1: Pro_CA [Gemmata massiliana]